MKVVKLPKYPCSFCRKNEATQLCDFVVDYSGKTFVCGKDGEIIQPDMITCDNQICKECLIEYNGHEFCPSCNDLHKLIKEKHDRRERRLPFDSIFGRESEPNETNGTFSTRGSVVCKTDGVEVTSE